MEPASEHIGIMHNLAKSGGTIIARCLGAMRKIWLFSEIHPRGQALYEKIYGSEFSMKYNLHTQAQYFYDLNSPDLLLSQTNTFSDVVKALVVSATNVKRTVVIRNWAHIDFLGQPFTVPSGKNELVEAIDGHIKCKHLGILRHPVDQWLSMSTREVFEDVITLNSYLQGYRRFLEQPMINEWILYEDFVTDPNQVLQTAARSLGVAFDPEWTCNWQDNWRITGDKNVTGPHVPQIIKSQRPPMEEGLMDQFMESQDYQMILKKTGYPHPETTS